MANSIISRISGEKGNSIRYKILYAACFIVHTSYAVLFGCIGVIELMVFNIFSSLMYFSGFLFIKEGKSTIVWMILVNAEIIANGVLCSLIVGYNYQFALFSFAVMPITYFMTYLDPAFKRPIVFSSVLAFIHTLSIVTVLYRSARYDAVYPAFPVELVNLIAEINTIFALLVLISFSILFTGKISSDMKKLKAQNDELDYLANYDQLTGLRNRNHIREIFWQYIISKEPYCVILGDIDDFKHVNDTYGHSAGDEVLKTVSSIIKETIGDNGEVCRWGGEEILIIVKGPVERGSAIAKKVLDNIREAVVENGNRPIKVTMTFGISDYTDAMNIEKLISIADDRLYTGKESGKNQIVTEKKIIA